MERFLTDHDKALLLTYQAKCSQVSDFTLACIRGTHTGMLLFGSGGNGKSYSVRETLDKQRIKEIPPEFTMDRDQDDDEDGEEGEPVKVEFGYDSWVNHQGRITPKGLVKEMARFPQSLHLVEDAETMFDDKNCWGVLRMALHSQDHSLHSKRRVTWKISTKDSYDFFFTGSLFIIGNRLLNDSMSEVEAVKTRCPCLNFEISNAELVAKMKELCERGYREIPGFHLNKDDCYTVLEFMLNSIESNPDLKRDKRGAEKKLNLRILISGFRLMVLGRMERSINWQNMLLDQMKQLVGSGGTRKREERIYDEKAIAKEIAAKTWTSLHAKLVEWCKQTGRDLKWSDADRSSEEYMKGFRAAKTDFNRKNK